jgi:hypothetical protein
MLSSAFPDPLSAAFPSEVLGPRRPHEREPRSRGLGTASVAFEARERLAVVPGHPLLRVLRQLIGVPLEFGEVVEGVRALEFASVDQAHQGVADLGPVLRLEEETVLPVLCRDQDYAEFAWV